MIKTESREIPISSPDWPYLMARGMRCPNKGLGYGPTNLTPDFDQQLRRIKANTFPFHVALLDKLFIGSL